MINQHKKMAMGKSLGYAKGGVIVKPVGVMPAIKGQPMNPITKAKMANGIPGFKAGGKVKA